MSKKYFGSPFNLESVQLYSFTTRMQKMFLIGAYVVPAPISRCNLCHFQLQENLAINIYFCFIILVQLIVLIILQ